MSRLSDGLRKVSKSPGVPKARHLAERTVAPYVRHDVHVLGLDHELTVGRLAALEQKVEDIVGAIGGVHDLVRQLERHQPTILNAIASTNGTSRLLAREATELREHVGELESRSDHIAMELQSGDNAVRSELRPHIDTIGFLLQRVEVIRAEMMHELRYGQAAETASIESKIINPDKLKQGDLRLNLGAGHIALDEFINVDIRELPGINVVAQADRLPFEPGSVTEIFSSHTVEHFPELELRRTLLPYWKGLLKSGGVFRAVVPDLEAMTKAYPRGEISFESLRQVVYGGQEYEGDFHFNGFTPQSLSEVLVQCGFRDPRIIAEGRPNGECLEFEVAATKPAS